MSAKKETKLNSKKIAIGSLPVNQRSPSTKNQNKVTVTNSNGLKDSNPMTKIDADDDPMTVNKTTPTKTSRNQVSANWNSVAATFKSQRTIPSSKKIGKSHMQFCSLESPFNQ